MDGPLHSLIEATYLSVHSNGTRWHPRLCSLGDLLAVCTSSVHVITMLASSLSDELLDLCASVVACDQQESLCIDTLGGSAKLSLLFLFATFGFCFVGLGTLNDQTRELVLTQRRNANEKLFIYASGFFSVLEIAMSQGSSADMTHRALILQNSLHSLNGERTLALTLTKANSSVARKELTLRCKLKETAFDLKEMVLKFQKMEVERDDLSNSIQGQHLAHERRLALLKSETQMALRNTSEIHVNERKQAEEQYHCERELRIKAEQENEQLARDISSNKSRITELEKQLELECKSRQAFESHLERCKHELSTISNAHQDTTEKLLVSEGKVSELTAISEDAAANLEDTCAKLIKLATLYQSNESEIDKYQAEVRSTVDTHNRQFDAAIQKSKAWRKKYEEANQELKELKAHKADIQRMRKNAPVAYLNQLHNDPKMRDKKQSRRHNTGKENARR